MYGMSRGYMVWEGIYLQGSGLHTRMHSESFHVGVGVSQMHVMSLWVLIIYVDNCKKGIKTNIIDLSLEFKMRGNGQSLILDLFAYTI